ncbi:MAG: hypothetical protein AAF267_22965 [Deinococcota bacterium]
MSLPRIEKTPESQAAVNAYVRLLIATALVCANDKCALSPDEFNHVATEAEKATAKAVESFVEQLHKQQATVQA